MAEKRQRGVYTWSYIFPLAGGGGGEFPVTGVTVSQQIVFATPTTRQILISVATFHLGQLITTPPALAAPMPYAIVGLTQGAVGLTNAIGNTGIGDINKRIIVQPNVDKNFIVPPMKDLWANVRAESGGAFDQLIISVVATDLDDRE